MQNIRKNEHVFNINMESCLTIGVAQQKGQNTWPIIESKPTNQPNGAQRFRLPRSPYTSRVKHTESMI